MQASRWLTGGAIIALLISGCGGGDDAGDAGGDGAASTDAITVEAGDLYFDPEELTTAAGEVTVTLDNVGSAEHDFVIEEAGDVEVVYADPGESATGTVELEAGTYTYYCSIPGHRTAGMEGTLEVS
ncbi:hypothetical protein FTX61_04905 [Nitriliruptoraceae bacterium ZYF776]|nr:hypothetical protein [Profundirhabdus halotolerans]